jgi:hypothetical protein
MILILYLLFSLPLYHEDKPGLEKTAQLVAIAHAVHKERLTLEQMVFLITWGEFETHYSLRIHAGQCHKWECDPIMKKETRIFRAKGPWQSQTRNLPIGIEWTSKHVSDAAKYVRWTLKECHKDVPCAYAMLAGRKRPTDHDHARAYRARVLLARAQAGVPLIAVSRLHRLLQPVTSSKAGKEGDDP